MFIARQFIKRCWLKSVMLSTGIGLLSVAESSASSVDFYRDVYPFLKANCLACHNKTTTKAGLDMETPESMRKGGDSGPGIVPGKSRESLVVLASLHQKDMEMPPANNKSGAVKLTSAEVALLKAWIDQGAKSSVAQERQVVWQSLAAGVHPIYSLAMTKDGRYAVCGRSNNLFLYDLATRQFVTQIVDESQKSGTAHRALVQSLAYSPDGKRIASGSFREVKIWREEKVAAVTRPAKAAYELQVSTLTDDGKQMVGATSKGGLLLLDTAKGKINKRIADVNKAGIRLLRTSPDGALAAVWGNEATLGVWSLKTGKPVAVKTDVVGIRTLDWTSDGLSLVTAGEDKLLRVWSLPSVGSAELVQSKELKGAAGAVTAMSKGATPDALITASEDGKLRIWSISKASVTREMPAVGVTCLGLSPDGRQLATGGADGMVRIWDGETGKQLTELRGRVNANQQIASLEWTVAAQGMEQSCQKKEAARIDAQNKALDELLKKANEAIVAMKKVVPEKTKAVKPAQTPKQPRKWRWMRF